VIPGFGEVSLLATRLERRSPSRQTNGADMGAENRQTIAKRQAQVDAVRPKSRCFPSTSPAGPAKTDGTTPVKPGPASGFDDAVDLIAWPDDVAEIQERVAGEHGHDTAQPGNPRSGSPRHDGGKLSWV